MVARLPLQIGARTMISLEHRSFDEINCFGKLFASELLRGQCFCWNRFPATNAKCFGNLLRRKTREFDCRADLRSGTIRMSSDFPWQAAHRINTTEPNVGPKRRSARLLMVNLVARRSVNIDVRWQGAHVVYVLVE